jgi:hypothetical protein
MPFEWADALKAVISAGVGPVVNDISKANAQAYEDAYKAKAGKFDDTVKAQIARNVEEWANVSNDSIVDTLQDEITNKLQEAYDSNMSTQDLSRELDNIFEGRGELIARTEVSKSIGTGKFKGMKASGAKTKQWFHADQGPTGRSSHQELDDEGPIPIDQPWETELGPIMYPGDPNADVGDLCNCGCSASEGEEGDYEE